MTEIATQEPIRLDEGSVVIELDGYRLGLNRGSDGGLHVWLQGPGRLVARSDGTRSGFVLHRLLKGVIS